MNSAKLELDILGVKFNRKNTITMLNKLPYLSYSRYVNKAIKLPKVEDLLLTTSMLRNNKYVQVKARTTIQWFNCTLG